MRLSSPEIKTAACRVSLVEFGRGGYEFHFGHVEFEISIRLSIADVNRQLSRIWSLEEKSGLEIRIWGVVGTCMMSEALRLNKITKWENTDIEGKSDIN